MAADDRARIAGRAAFTVHDADQALAVLAAADAVGRPVLLLSPPGAAAFLGAGFFRALADRARAVHPGADALFILDCADAAGDAMAALRAGVDGIIFKGAGAGADRAGRALAGLADRHGAAGATGAAGPTGAVYLSARPPSVDLGDVPDVDDACHARLAAAG